MYQTEFSFPHLLQTVNEASTSESVKVSTLGELGDVIYVPPPELDVPPEIIVPPTLKLAKVVLKTANFISSEGAQMEIVLKAKQANNPMFQFLHFDSALHPFYRHVLTAIRNRTYVVPAEDDAAADAENNNNENTPVTATVVNGGSKDDSEDSDTSESSDDHYLHPSLQPAKVLVIISQNQN